MHFWKNNIGGPQQLMEGISETFLEKFDDAWSRMMATVRTNLPSHKPISSLDPKSVLTDY